LSQPLGLSLIQPAKRALDGAIIARELGYRVDYYPAQPHFKPALEADMAKHHRAHVRLMETAEYGRSAQLAETLKTYEVCEYDLRRRIGENACPFNSLYWDFVARNYDRLKANPRMNLVLAVHDKFDRRQVVAIRERAAQIRQSLGQGQP
jgi:deoxyribodipyrimidine photolyase-like uncharacterized protein